MNLAQIVAGYMILAQIVAGYSLGHLLIAVVVIAACVALVYVALQQFGISIPAWVVQVAWIIAVAFIVILAIRFVMGL